MDDMPKLIGSNIRKFRKLRGMTREQLAEVLGLDTAYLGQCERGERQLGLSKTIEIIEYFGVTPNDIITVKHNRASVHKQEYLNEIHQLLNSCTDHQLLAILRILSPLVNFLKE